MQVHLGPCSCHSFEAVKLGTFANGLMKLVGRTGLKPGKTPWLLEGCREMGIRKLEDCVAI